MKMQIYCNCKMWQDFFISLPPMQRCPLLKFYSSLSNFAPTFFVNFVHVNAFSSIVSIFSQFVLPSSSYAALPPHEMIFKFVKL